LPINATEKRWFDAIDGNRSIGEIADKTLTSAHKKTQIEELRGFFERLWWYDQVVIDASQSAKTKHLDFRLPVMFNSSCVFFRPAGRKKTHNNDKVPCCRRLKRRERKS